MKRINKVFQPIPGSVAAIADAAGGNHLVVDRQTSVGVDIAEQTAAKTALENAADVFAERVIPKLAP